VRRAAGHRGNGNESGTEVLVPLQLYYRAEPDVRPHGAARSEWKVNIGNQNSSRSNDRWRMTPKTVFLESRGEWTCVSLQCMSTSGGSIYAPITFLSVD